MTAADRDELPAGRCTSPIRLRPRMVERVWGGDRFPNTSGVPIGEAWLVHESNIVLHGFETGSSLAETVIACGESILGSKLWNAGERSFPLLVKLIDAREWLSIQVHPTDALAQELEGPGNRGKSEAWYALDAMPDTEIIAGVRDGIGRDELVEAIRSGSIDAIVERFSFGPGSAIALPAGTIHALGPGAFIYEIQQSSDITYRVFDWNRPQTAGRKLHLEQSIRAADVTLRPRPMRLPPANGSAVTPMVTLPQFTLVRVEIEAEPLRFATEGEVFHLVTVIFGEATLSCGDQAYSLSPWDTLLIPAAAPPYGISSPSSAVLLQAVPDTGAA